MSEWPDLFPDQVGKYRGGRWGLVCLAVNAFCDSLYSKNNFVAPPLVEQDDLNATLLMRIAQSKLFSDRDATFMFYLWYYGARSQEIREHMAKTIEVVYKSWRTE